MTNSSQSNNTLNKNQVAFVTGAATGIGRAIAERLLKAGLTVGVYDLRLADWVDNYPNAIAGVLDVTDSTAWQTVLNDFVTQTGRLDILVNNAGVLYDGAFVQADFAKDSALVDVNVKGVLYGCRAAYPYLKATKGQVLNLSSAASIYGTPEMATYSATKFAVRGITEALEQEWLNEHIKVRSLMPLYVKTAMLDGVETAGTRKMGIRLNADDVADEAIKVISSNTATVHHAVGTQTKALWALSQVTPNFITRLMNVKLTTKG